MFIQSICNDTHITSPTQTTINSLDSSISKGKKEFKEIKDQNSKLLLDITKIINDILDVDEKFRKDKENIMNLVSDAEVQFEKLIEISQSILDLKKQNHYKSVTIKDKLSTSINWHENFNRMVETLKGFKTISYTVNSVLIEIIPTIPLVMKQHQLSIQFDTVKQRITGCYLSPMIPGLVEEVTENLSSGERSDDLIKDISELIQEVQSSLINYYQRENEIIQLSKLYTIQVQEQSFSASLNNTNNNNINNNISNRSRIISVQLKNPVYFCTLVLDTDYPTYSTVTLLSIQKLLNSTNSQSVVSDLESFQKKINENKLNLLQLLNEIEIYLQQL
eukprot:gene1969-2420_t